MLFLFYNIPVMLVSVTVAWCALRLWMEDTASRYEG